MNQVIIQGIGYLALFFVIFSFQKGKRRNILLTMLVGLVLFVVHYILLGAWTGAFMNLLEAGVVYVAHKKEDALWAQKRYWLYIFIALFIVTGFFTSKTLINWLPVVAQIFGTVAVWQNNPKAIRFLMLAPRPLWFVYNLVVGSQAGMAAEVFIFFSVLIGIVRFDVLAVSMRRPERSKKTAGH